MRSPRCLLFVLSLAACGPAVTYDVPPNQNPNGSGAPVGSGSPTAAAGDETVTLATPIAITGVVFEPQAFDTYGMRGAGPKNPKTTLDQQRAQFAKEKNVLFKQAYAVVLASMLYKEANGKTAADAAPYYEEARKALEEATSAAK